MGLCDVCLMEVADATPTAVAVAAAAVATASASAAACCRPRYKRAGWRLRYEGPSKIPPSAARWPLPTWDVSRVDDLTDLFKAARGSTATFPDGTCRASKFSRTFYRAESFNGDLSRWDTAKSTSFRSTFWAAETFMRGVSRWDTAKSTTFYGTFSGASGFHGDVSRWDTASATTFSKCFHLAENFQGDISKWDTSRATHDDAAFFELKRENVAAKNRSRSAPVCTSRAPPSPITGHEFGMAQRAARWRQCVADRGRSRDSVRPGDYVAVDVCRPARCGYIHVFKSGSQTVGEAFRTACAMAFGEAVEAGGTKTSAVDIAPSTVSTQCSPKLRASMGCHGPIIWANCNVSFFTVVRDPMERWPSGVYEVARREPAGWPASLYERAREDRRATSSCAVFELQPRANPHLQPRPTLCWARRAPSCRSSISLPASSTSMSSGRF